MCCSKFRNNIHTIRYKKMGDDGGGARAPYLIFLSTATSSPAIARLKNEQPDLIKWLALAKK